MSSKQGSGYMRLSMSAGTNEIVTYHSILLSHVKAFRNKVNNCVEGTGVRLFTASEGGDNFDVGHTIKFVNEDKDGKSFVGWRAYNENKEFVVPYRKVQEKKRVHWTTEDVCEFIIKPKCAEMGSYYTDLVKNDLLDGNDVVNKDEYAGTFVSYARQTKFNDMIDALDCYFEDIADVDRSNVYIWMDIFCANQPALTSNKIDMNVKDMQYDLLTVGLHQAISKFPCKVIVFDDWRAPSVLKRAWCVWEVFGVALSEKELVQAGKEVNVSAKLGIAMVAKEVDSFVSSLRDNGKFDDIRKSLCTIDVAKAECFNPVDKQNIKEAIEKKSSYAEVNETVLKQLRAWHIRTAGNTLNNKRSSMDGTMNSQDDLATLSNSVGTLMQDQVGENQFIVLIPPVKVICRVILKVLDLSTMNR